MKIFEVTHNHHIYLHASSEAAVVKLLQQISKKEDQIMASIDDVKAQVAAKAVEVKTEISAAIAAEKTEVAAAILTLKNQIESGATISQADLDSILESVSGIGSDLAAEVEAINE